MSETRVVYHSAYESLFTPALRGRITSSIEDELRAAGVDLKKKFDPVYPLPVWLETLRILARSFHPTLTFEAACVLLGRDTIDGFTGTLVGRASFAALRVIGVRRAVERAARTYAVTNNYTRVTLTPVGPTSYDFHMNEFDVPAEFDVGVLGRCLELLGASAPQVTVTARDETGFTLRLSWAA